MSDGQDVLDYWKAWGISPSQILNGLKDVEEAGGKNAGEMSVEELYRALQVLPEEMQKPVIGFIFRGGFKRTAVK